MATATFSEHSHTYKVDGEVIPSVTQVLTLAGISDVSGIPAHILQRASEIGTAVHLATELLDKDDLDLDSLDPQIVGYVTAYQRFKEESGVTYELIEHRTTAEYCGIRYGMCVDRVGAIGGKMAVFDIKTSSKPQASWKIQTAAYTHGLGDADTFERRIVHLCKDGSYKQICYDDPNDHTAWGAALVVAQWRLQNGAKIR